MAEGSTDYTLGYYPDDKNLDGRFRKIEVKLHRRGVQAHYRKGYFAMDPKLVDEQTAQNQFYGALAPQAPLSTAILSSCVSRIWNNSMTPSWDSKNTININIEMNRRLGTHGAGR